MLVNPGGLVRGTFSGSVDSAGAAVPFRAGTDVVVAGYTPTEVAVGRGGQADADGVVRGVLPSGPYQVRSSLGGAAGLVVLETNGRLEVVVRNNSAASTLTIPPPSPADPLVRGLAVNGGGALTLVAPTTNFTGDLLVGGALRSLTAKTSWPCGCSAAAGRGRGRR